MQTLWQQVLSRWQDKRQTINGITYLMKQLNEEEFELTKYVLGPCGEKNYHPRILLTVIENQPVAQSLLDLEVTPVLRYTRSENPLELDSALEQLLLEFKDKQEFLQ